MSLYNEYAISAILAKFAYTNEDALESHWLNTRDSSDNSINNVFHDVKEAPCFYSDSITGAYAYSIQKEKTLYFVFRGTNDVKDVVVDLAVARIPFFEGKKQRDIKVHYGFMKQFTALKRSIVKTTIASMKQVNTIHFIGHSLGGALATLFAGYIGRFYRGYFDGYMKKISVICHTFGSPRVGNKAYVRWFQENVRKMVRITNFKDPVAQMPISAYYQHVSDALCIMDDMTVKDIPDGKWYWRLSNFKVNVCKPVLAHSCDQYIERLMKLCDKKDNLSCADITKEQVLIE